MGLVFNDFPIKGIDVSEYNGSIEWDKVKAKGCDFTTVRIGYGKTTDAKFTNNWSLSKVIHRIPYWYMDYYSNHNSYSSVYGMGDYAWGEAQAVYCWNLIKNDMDGATAVFLDIESGGASYSPTITTVTERAHNIARGFLDKMDALNGKLNGIYTSLGFLSWLGKVFSHRPLWVAWYNETMTVDGVMQNRTVESVVASSKARGWTGEVLIWQYASDGDATGDGIGDGLDFGMDYKSLDLNAWTSTAQRYSQFVGGSIIVPEPPVEPPAEPLILYYPLPEGIRITQLFGMNPSWYPSSKGHNGIDWGCAVGTPIYAMHSGDVIRADAIDGKYSYGRQVRIQDARGVSIYGHLSKLMVTAGTKVSAKQLIGYSGGNTSDPQSGFSTGAHLHAEYRLEDVPNPVPGGYTYNAIDILPLLKSHEQTAPPPSLYSVKVVVANLNVRTSPYIVAGNIIRTIGFITVPVYEEKNGFGRINSSQQEWISLNSAYSVKITAPLPPPPSTVTVWQVTATSGVNVRKSPSIISAKIGAIAYNTVVKIDAINGNWGQIYEGFGKGGWISLTYAKKI